MVLKGAGKKPVAALVVDDDDSMRAIAVRAIERAFPGARILEASEGGAAFGLLMQNAVDLLVTDVMMPQSDGKSLIQSLRRLPKGMSPKAVIVMSAFEKPEIQGVAVPWRFLRKPLTVELIAAAARELVKG